MSSDKQAEFWVLNSHLKNNIESQIEYKQNDWVQEIQHEVGQKSTINMYVESHYELNISLFGKVELTTDIINNAYLKLLDEHVKSIQKGIECPFNISDKQKARDYLLNKISNQN